MTQKEIEESEWADNQLAAMKQPSEPPVAGSAIGYAPSSELILFVRKQIAHKIGRHSWSREWSEGQIHDAANMIADYCKAHNSDYATGVAYPDHK